MAKKPKLDLTVQGVTGLPVWSGRVYDEVLLELQGERGRKIFREMSEQDPIIGGILLGVEMLARQVSWTMKAAEFPDDEAKTEKAKEVADFVDECLTDMYPSFGNTLSEILSMLRYGWSWLEILYKKREGINVNSPLKSSRFEDGKIGWAGWSIRSQESLHQWEYENDVNGVNVGELTAMIQRGAPDYIEHRIPRAKSLHFTTRSQRENPEGSSFLRNAYRAWYLKKNIEVIEGIGIERDLAGMPVLTAPAELFSESASVEEKALLTQLRNIVTSIKRDEQEGILLPMAFDENKNPLYKLELLSTGGDRQINTNDVINRYDERIAMSMLADFILMGHQAVGSFALSTSKTGLFSTALDAILDVLAGEINLMGIPKLVLLNGYDLEMTPALMHGKIEAADLAKLGAFLKSLADAGMGVFPNIKLEKYLLEEAGLPGDPGAGMLPFPVDETGNPIDPKTGLPLTPDIQVLPGQQGQLGPGGLPLPKPKGQVGGNRKPVSPQSAGKQPDVKPTTAPPNAIRANETLAHHRHFVPLASRVARVQAKLSAAMDPDDYRELLAEVMAKGKYSRLDQRWKAAISAAEADEL